MSGRSSTRVSGISIDHGVSAYVFQRLADEFCLSEKSVEGFDMRFDGSLKERVGAPVSRWFSEELVSAEGVIFDAPVGVGAWSHFRGGLSPHCCQVDCDFSLY